MNLPTPDAREPIDFPPHAKRWLIYCLAVRVKLPLNRRAVNKQAGQLIGIGRVEGEVHDVTDGDKQLFFRDLPFRNPYEHEANDLRSSVVTIREAAVAEPRSGACAKRCLVPA